MYTIQEFVKSDVNLVKTLQVIDKLSDFYVENKCGQEQTWLLWFAVQDNIIEYNTTNYENVILFFFDTMYLHNIGIMRQIKISEHRVSRKQKLNSHGTIS